ncbi:MAG: hypothetical protein Q4F17_00470 [Eubacteriales bacterium]|nr:hypothetical protein [Eubacteriales bacterium]
MNALRIIVPLFLTALLFLSGCSRQQPLAAIPDAAISVIDTTAPQADVTGVWKLDGPATEDGLKNHESLLAMFGTGLQEGTNLELSSDGAFTYYIGVSAGGEGTYSRSGDRIDATVIPYVEGQRNLSLTVLTGDGETRLAMELEGETLYWQRAAEA